MEKIKLGVSSCLLGEKVRYDGGHKLDHFLKDTLGRFVTWIPVCPETECGLPVPREAMRLVGDPADPRLVGRKSGTDHTDRMKEWGKTRLEELAGQDLCGFVFKSKSPSSGFERVKVYTPEGMPSGAGAGLWARMFMNRFPFLPVEDEGRLHDPKLREMFIERIFVLQRWRRAGSKKKTVAGLIDFHTRHKYLFLAHSPTIYRELGRIAAAGKTEPAPKLFDQYHAAMTRALAVKTTVKKNANVLEHLLGYFKKHLSADEKQEFLEILREYAAGHVPLIVPVTLINHWVRKYDQPYLKEQHYLNPHPLELKLRNHA